MSNTTPSPNMNMPIPTVAVDPGPDWATNINASLGILDGHTHIPSQNGGVQITPAALNLNSDVTFLGNNATNLRSVRFSPQAAPISAGADIGCLYESGVDLYYNDGSGNQIRITASGSVTGSAGTITGLPSGTASASYSGGTFTFQSATSTPANLSVGPISIGDNTSGSKQITIQPASGIAANYSLYLPAASPTANQVLVSDGSGNLTWTRGLLPLGAVIATFPNLSGAYSTTNTTTADSNGYVLCTGQTIADSSSPMNGAVVPNINNSVFIQGSTTAGTSGGAASVTLSTTNLPSHTHGAGSYATSVGVTGGTASLTGTTTFAAINHVHNMAHYHQSAYEAGGNYYYNPTASTSQGTFTNSGTANMLNFVDCDLPGSAPNDVAIWSSLATASHFTSGSLGQAYGSGSSAETGIENLDATVGISSTGASITGSNSVTGTSGATGSGNSFSIVPTYISAVYLMRIK